MYLHNNRELFKDIVNAASEMHGLVPAIIEKDYYVTMILKELSKRYENVVFKGGTSLSKCYHVINRFSEDIDITFTEHIGESRRKKLKYNVLGEISKVLDLSISNWGQIESDKDYNCYMFTYVPINNITESLLAGVKLETALASYAFPVEYKAVDNYIREFLVKENKTLIEEYGLDIFRMKVQSLERTFIDKIFALCDYYLQGKSERYSRHLYDVYKAAPYIKKDEKFKELVREVRKHRAGLKICPSSKSGINIRRIVNDFCDEHFYESDYHNITSYFIKDTIQYNDTIRILREFVDEGYFDE